MQRECPTCKGAGLVCLGLFPDAPDAEIVSCKTCRGWGEVAARCDCHREGLPAVALIEGEYFCRLTLAKGQSNELKQCA